MITKAKRRALICSSAQAPAIEKAIASLKTARQWLRDAGSKNAADYVARAIKSAEGARNHADRMARSAQPARKP